MLYFGHIRTEPHQSHPQRALPSAWGQVMLTRRCHLVLWAARPLITLSGRCILTATALFMSQVKFKNVLCPHLILNMGRYIYNFLQGCVWAGGGSPYFWSSACMVSANDRVEYVIVPSLTTVPLPLLSRWQNWDRPRLSGVPTVHNEHRTHTLEVWVLLSRLCLKDFNTFL